MRPTRQSPVAGSEAFSDDGLPSLQGFPEDVQALLMGRLAGVRGAPLAGSRLISLYVCCGLADLEAEREHLERHVYPAVRAHAADRGYDLNVVDLHWGVQVEALDRATFAHLCLQTIARLRTQGHFLALVRSGGAPFTSNVLRCWWEISRCRDRENLVTSLFCCLGRGSMYGVKHFTLFRTEVGQKHAFSCKL